MLISAFQLKLIVIFAFVDWWPSERLGHQTVADLNNEPELAHKIHSWAPFNASLSALIITRLDNELVASRNGHRAESIRRSCLLNFCSIPIGKPTFSLLEARSSTTIITRIGCEVELSFQLLGRRLVQSFAVSSGAIILSLCSLDDYRRIRKQLESHRGAEAARSARFCAPTTPSTWLPATDQR